MKLTRAAILATNACCLMVGKDKVTASHVLAAETGMPERFLLKTLRPLVGIGVLDSVKGPSGGFKLAKPPEAITLLEITEAVDSKIRGLNHTQLADVEQQFASNLAQAYENIIASFRHNLGKITIADLKGKQ